MANAQPPSASRGALWSFKSEFLEEAHPSAAVEDATKTQAPTDSTRFIGSSEHQLPAGGKSEWDRLGDESVMPTPQHKGVHFLLDSRNQYQGENGNRGLDEIDRWSVTHSHFVSEYDSVLSIVDSSEADEYVVPPPRYRAVRRPFVHFTNLDLVENGKDEFDEIERWGVTHSHFVRKYDSVHNIVDPSEAEEYTVPPPQHTAVKRPLVNSSNQHRDVNDKSASDETKRTDNGLSTNTRGFIEEQIVKHLHLINPYQDENGNDELDKIGRWGFSHSHFVRKYDSIHSILDPSEAEEYTIPPPQHTTVGRSLMQSINSNLDEKGNDELDKIDRWGVTHSHYVRKYESVHSIVDPSKADEYIVPHPQDTTVRQPLVHFSNPDPVEKGNDELDETDRWGVTHSCFVRKYDSVLSIVHPSETEEYIVPPPQHTAVRGTLVYSSNQHLDVNDKIASDETKRTDDLSTNTRVLKEERTEKQLNSIDPHQGGNGNDELDKSDRWGVAHSHFVPNYNSVHNIVDPFEVGEYTIPPPQGMAVRRPSVQSTNPKLLENINDELDEIDRLGVTHSHFVHEYDSILSIVDSSEADEYIVPPPRYRAVRRPFMNFTNLDLVENGNDEFDETERWGVTRSHFVRKYDSVHNIVDPSKAEEYTVPPPQHTTVKRPLVNSSNQHRDVNDKSASDETKRTDNGLSTNTRGFIEEQTMKQLHSGNQYQVEDGNNELDKIGRWGFSHSHFVRKYDSVHSILDPSEAEECTIPPPQHTTVGRSVMQSINSNLVEKGNDELDKIDRWGVTHSHYVRKYESVHSIVDPSEADEYIVPHPQDTTVRHPLVHFSNPDPVENGNDELDETDRWGVTHSCFVRKYDSVLSIDPSETEEYIVPPPQHTAVRGPLVYSSNQHLGVNDEIASDETERTDNGLSTNTRGLTEENTMKQLNSRDPYQGENGNGELDIIDRRAVTHSHFVRKYDSVHSIIDPYEAEEHIVQPLQHTAERRPFVHFTNPNLAADGNDELDEIDGNDELDEIDRWGVTHSCFVSKYDSVVSIVDPSEAEEYTVPPPQHTTVQGGPLVYSSNQHPDVNDKSASDEIKRTDNDLSTNTRGLTEEKTVKHLRLWNTLTVPDTTTIYEARCQMVAQNVDVLVLTDSYALPSGILRHKDIETRVLDCEIDFVNTPVSKVMKRNPTFVSFDTLAVDALQKMVEGEVTQLPVIENGKVIGLVCILDCLHKTNSDAERRALRLCVADWDALQKYC